MGREERYERARESLDVVRALWDSWAKDAFVQDKATGQYLDPHRVRLTNHRGKHFAVKGPLNVARTPQGQRQVPVSVRFQACSDRECLLPRTVHLSVPLEVVDPRAS